MKELEPTEVLVRFVCDGCGTKVTENMANVPYTGAPICLTHNCSNLNDEMDIDVVIIEK